MTGPKHAPIVAQIKEGSIIGIALFPRAKRKAVNPTERTVILFAMSFFLSSVSCVMELLKMSAENVAAAARIAPSDIDIIARMNETKMRESMIALKMIFVFPFSSPSSVSVIKVAGDGFVMEIKHIRKIPAEITVHQIIGERQNLLEGFLSLIISIRLIAVGKPTQPKDMPMQEKMFSTEIDSVRNTFGMFCMEEWSLSPTISSKIKNPKIEIAVPNIIILLTLSEATEVEIPPK